MMTKWSKERERGRVRLMTQRDKQRVRVGQAGIREGVATEGALSVQRRPIPRSDWLVRL